MIRRSFLLVLLGLSVVVAACAQLPQDRKALEESIRSGKAETSTTQERGR